MTRFQLAMLGFSFWIFVHGFVLGMATWAMIAPNKPAPRLPAYYYIERMPTFEGGT